jgi:selenide, water dikinase
MTKLRLTTLSRAGGCAGKLRISELAQVLRRLPQVHDPALLVGTETRDDAAVYRLGRRAHGQALVFTTDFFSPVVDDPFAFGRVAATNALSDVYAMGGTPLLALNLLAFPSAILPRQAVARILAGGAAACREAGIAVGGGHTLDDAEPKFGLAVVGLVDPKRLWRNVGARTGDVLLLTKPLGVGVVTTAIKRELARPAEVRAAIRSMTTLNRDAAATLRRFGAAIHAVTDVTGFGLLGHLLEMLDGSERGARISLSAVPMLPGARRLAALECFSGGTRANLEQARTRLRLAAGVRDDPHAALLLADAQTSGGLLAAVAPRDAARIAAALKSAGVRVASIGTITAPPVRITVEP